MSEHHHLSSSCVAQIDWLIDGIALSLAEQAAARLTPTQSDARDTRKIQVPSLADVAHAYVRAPTISPRYTSLPSDPYWLSGSAIRSSIRRDSISASSPLLTCMLLHSIRFYPCRLGARQRSCLGSIKSLQNNTSLF